MIKEGIPHLRAARTGNFTSPDLDVIQGTITGLYPRLGKSGHHAFAHQFVKILPLCGYARRILQRKNLPSQLSLVHVDGSPAANAAVDFNPLPTAVLFFHLQLHRLMIAHQRAVGRKLQEVQRVRDQVPGSGGQDHPFQSHVVRRRPFTGVEQPPDLSHEPSPSCSSRRLRSSTQAL